jgi:hypothetical protein
VKERSGSAFLAMSIAIASLALAACGGSSDDSSTSTSVTAPTAAPTSRQHGENSVGDTHKRLHAEGKGGESKSSQDVRSADSGRSPVTPLEVSGGGSGQFRVKGGDNSVQEYGAEADATELRQAAATVHSFFVAQVRLEWARACSVLAAGEREDLERLAASSPRSRGKGCAGALAVTTKAVSPSLARQLTTLDAASLRQEGDQAFLIYTAPPGRTVYAMPLRREDGAWRLGALSGAELPGT